MRIFNAALILAVMLLGTIASDDALAARRGISGRSAHRSHSGHVPRHARVGVFLGAPLFAPMYYPPSGYYYNPSLPAGPTVYIEQERVPADAEAADPQYWYYCRESSAYYPYVSECPQGWQQVVPETSPPASPPF